MWLFPEASRLVTARKFFLPMPLGIFLAIHRDQSRFPVNKGLLTIPLPLGAEAEVRAVLGRG